MDSSPLGVSCGDASTEDLTFQLARNFFHRSGNACLFFGQGWFSLTECRSLSFLLENKIAGQRNGGGASPDSGKKRARGRRKWLI
jgi:hypothetical protein